MIHVQTGVITIHKNSQKCKNGKPNMKGSIRLTNGNNASCAINGMMNNSNIMNFLFKRIPPFSTKK